MMNINQNLEKSNWIIAISNLECGSMGDLWNVYYVYKTPVFLTNIWKFVIDDHSLISLVMLSIKGFVYNGFPDTRI